MNAQLTPAIILSIVVFYFTMLMLVSWFTSKNATNQDFFNAKKKSPWLLVAIGMIGASLSGVTFISIPGVVGAGDTNMAFSYMQMVLGYLLGYFIIATVLMPIYYKMNLTTIYGYLENRFGPKSYKMGAFYFILSRIIGASFRLFLVVIVLDQFVLAPMGVPFWLTVLITIALIWSYTFKAGIKTIVWTDTLQTVFMLTAVVATVFAIINHMDSNIADTFGNMKARGLTQIFFFEDGWSDPNNFFKQFISGALIALVMTGLDQDMMQKNLTCRTLKDAQKNVFVFSIVLVIANLFFLTLGALLYIYADFLSVAIPDNTDTLYPLLALNHLPIGIGICFIIGLIAAAYSSADSALTSLTTSFCVDFLDFENTDLNEEEKTKKRWLVHIAFSLIIFVVIILFNYINDEAVINGLFKAAGYTYGPILGLFGYGILTNKKIKDKWVIWVALAAPVLTYIVDLNSENWFGGLKFGFLILAVNGLITCMGLVLISKSK